MGFATDAYTVIRLAGREYALPAERVREMVCLPPVTAVPHLPPDVRGVINLRGRLLPVVDLRLRLGMASLTAEMDEADLPQREQDHVNWVAELERCITEGAEFKLATDPHRCAFGQWYDHFQTDNVVLSGLLRRFDEPHRRLHASAAEAMARLGDGDRDGALELVAQVRANELATLRALFALTSEAAEEVLREIAVVVDGDDGPRALTADAVLAVEALGEPLENEGLDLAGLSRQQVTAVHRRARGDGMVMVLSPRVAT